MTRDQIGRLAAEMRANSERWFPGTHDPRQQDMPLDVFYTLGLSGEVGELANGIKKLHRDGPTNALVRNLRAEMADVFTYLLLLADHLGVDLVAEYQHKAKVNEQRWGTDT